MGNQCAIIKEDLINYIWERQEKKKRGASSIVIEKKIPINYGNTVDRAKV